MTKDRLLTPKNSYLVARPTSSPPMGESTGQELLRVLKNRKNILLMIEAGVLLFLLFFRLKIGIVRYFDIDEFAYLHWGYNLYIGERPYTDFLFLLPPLFLYNLIPLFILAGRSVLLLITARIFIFFVFLLTTFILILLGKKLRNIHTGFLAAIIFVFLPIPADKMIEIRPDLVALFWVLLGIYLFIIGMEKQKKLLLFLSGASFALSLGFIPKTVFFLLPPCAVLWFTGYKAASEGRLQKLLNHLYLPFTAGFVIPAVVIFVIILSFGNFQFALYSMIRLSSDIHKTLGAKFYMRPDIFFYPNDTYYGFPGTNNLPYILNLTIYFTASLWAIKNFISSLSYQDNKKCLREFVVAASFFVNLFAFVKFYPLKHAQYLIMLAPFIAFYFADLVMSIISKPSIIASPDFNRGVAIPRECTQTSCEIPLRQLADRNDNLNYPVLKQALVILVLLVIAFSSYQMYAKKSKWDNKATLEKVGRILSAVPKDERVFDLTGGSIFYRHGYYFCCLSYGQYEEILRFPIPDLEAALAKSNTKYVYTDFYGRLDILPPLQAKYIKENFVPYFPNGSLLIKK